MSFWQIDLHFIEEIALIFSEMGNPSFKIAGMERTNEGGKERAYFRGIVNKSGREDDATLRSSFHSSDKRKRGKPRGRRRRDI